MWHKENEQRLEEDEKDSEMNFTDEETTTKDKIENCHQWSKQKTKKSLMPYKDLTTVPKIDNPRETIIQINDQH